MEDNDTALKKLISDKVEKLSSEISLNRKKSKLVSTIACLPFVAAPIIAFLLIEPSTSGSIGLVLAVCAVGLTITIGLFGSRYWEAMRRAQDEIDRLETISMCLVAFSVEDLERQELLHLLTVDQWGRSAMVPMGSAKMATVESEPLPKN